MRTIESPGVEIREIDLSQNTQLPVGTTVFAVGYANQGPTDELINITSNSELEQIYGQPTNAAERYFYQTCQQVLAVNGTLLTTRLPYGSGSGDGFTTNYSALMFPVFPYDNQQTGSTSIQVSADQLFTMVDHATHTGAVTGIKGGGTFNFFQQASAVFDNYAGFDNSSVVITLTAHKDDSTDVAATFNYIPSSATFGTSIPGWEFGWTLLDNDFDSYRWTLTTGTSALTASDLVLSSTVSGLTASTLPTLRNSENYYFGQPTHVVINDTTYLNWLQGGINWKDQVPDNLSITDFAVASAAQYAGFIIVNELKSTLNENYEGYYVALADNSKTDKGSEFDVVRQARVFNDTTANDEWLNLNTDRLTFALSGTFADGAGSISEVVETLPGWDFANIGSGGFSDSIVLTVFRLRRSIYNTDESTLDYLLSESWVGSFDATRKITSGSGGQNRNFYIEDIVNNSSNNTRMFVNPNISTYSGVWNDGQTGEPLKKVRVKAAARTNEESSVATDPAEPHGKPRVTFDLTSSNTLIKDGDNLYGSGEYKICSAESDQAIGNLPLKLTRAVELAENRDFVRVDVVPEAGLGTVWTGVQLDMTNWPTGATNRTTFDQITQVFDDTVLIDGILNPHTFDADSDGLLDQVTGTASEASDLYETVYNIFNNFAQFTRKDAVYIADPLRYIFVQGRGDVKVIDDKTKNFSQHIFWPLKNLYATANSSYAATYANWFKTNDLFSGKFVWAPSSGWIARAMVNTDTNFFPWFAPAGLTRSILSDVLDIGINPTQKQRDLLYKNGINPVVFFPTDGYVIWGQKTLQTKPSALDRVNVRRLFLWLEKGVLQLARNFVFEQNTVFTRTRFKAAIAPIMDFARDNEGVFDYLIVCDERNNTPEVIDRNEMVVDIYIKPTRVAEFILVNFIATRTNQDFNELI